MPVTVLGEWTNIAKSEFAKVQVTVQAAKEFEVVDSVEQKHELGTLGVDWPDPVISGLLDSLMNTDLGPLRNIRVTLERVWYHEADSTRNASLMQSAMLVGKLLKSWTEEPNEEMPN